MKLYFIILSISVFLVPVRGLAQEDDDSFINILTLISATISDQGNDNETGPFDITNAIFTSTDADCNDYANSYFSTAKDIKNDVTFDAEVTMSEDTDELGECILDVNGIPNHDFNDQSASFANDVAEVLRTFTVTRNPQISVNPTNLAQNTWDGVMLNGVVLDLLSAGCYDPTAPNANADGNVAIGCNINNDDWLIDPLGAEGQFGADAHNAHTQPDGTYHYHGSPVAMFDDNPGANGSPVIGFAADGFPIYGTYFNDGNTVRKALASYQLKTGQRPGGANGTNDDPGGDYDGTYRDDFEYIQGSGDLDECNGMTVGNQYGYYVTDTFPWVLACHAGTPHNSFRK